MSLHDFIFSNNRGYRVFRHLCFWMGWFVFSGVVQLSRIIEGVSNELFFIINGQLMRSFNRLPGIFFFSYFVVYIFIPRFARNGKLRQFIVVLLFSFLLLYVGTFIWFRYVRVDPAMNSVPLWGYFYYSFYSNINFTGAIPTCCLMLAIKFYKNWSIKQQRSEQLGKENMQAELQLLKAQVHPHFLFNTLNNIYSFVLTKDYRAAGLVDKLAGMIDYMRTEGENSLVLLEKEIRLIKDYVGLEKVRYGERLEVQIEIHGNDTNKLIAPLLMIPFVENCFKHGASIMRGHQWIKLSITIAEDQLDFKLSNSKPPTSTTNVKKGIGLANVQKRLQLLYPDKHSLKINSNEDSYIVHLEISMEQLPLLDNTYKLIPKLQPA